MESKAQPVLLVLLTPDEVLVIRAYRTCDIENRAHIRYFAYAAAAQHAEHTAELIPFLGRKRI